MSVQDIVRAAFFTPTRDGWGLPLGIEAGPGTAKSSIMEQIAEACGLPIVVLAPGERGEGAFGAVPVPEQLPISKIKGSFTPEQLEEFKAAAVEHVTRLCYPAPDWVDTFSDGRGILFIDELTTAPPALQPAMLGLILARRIGGTRLPVGVRPITAYNKPEDAAAGYDLPKPTANRLGHIKWDAGGTDAWVDHMMGLGAGLRESESQQVLDPAKEEARVLAAWPEAFGQAKGLVTAFIQRFPTKLHMEPDAMDPAASRAWPSRRTWEFVMRSLASAQVHGLDEADRNELVAAYIGAGVANEFFAFIEEQDMPDPIAILDGKEKFEHDPHRLDRSIAVLSGCAAILVPKPDGKEASKKRDERAKRLLGVLTELVNNGVKDVAFGPARTMAKSGFIRLPEFRPVLAKLNKVLEAAGVTG